MKTKQEIRRECQEGRKKLTKHQMHEAGETVAHHLLESCLYKETPAILAYIAIKNELSTRPVLEASWADGKTVAAPRVENGEINFYIIHSYDDLEPGSFGVQEPKAECPLFEGEQALVLVPGMAYDHNGRRIGYGKGYYDGYLKEHRRYSTLGYAYAFQVYPVLPEDAWDRLMDDVLTEQGFLKVNQESMKQQYYMDLVRSLIKEKEQQLCRRLTACICTFGCQMNARDSEKLMGILREVGFKEQEGENADFVLYNTCTVRENANLRVYGRLGHLKSLKKQNPEMIIALCGCMMQEETVVGKIQKSYRFVDIIFGTHNIFKLAELLYRRLTGEAMVIDIWKDTNQIVEDLPAERKYSFKSGVNIMFGCNNFCSYCIVPYVRGRERSRNPEDILEEIRRLAADGVVEVMLLGQNVNSYGKNLDNPITFAELLEQIEAIPGIERIRFMTSHPKDLSDELIAVMVKSQKICRHLHLPLQSGSSRILKQMNRYYDKEQYLALAAKIQEAIPDISLTTDIIVGFPGETEEDFEETMEVVEKVRYDSAFTFIYSKRTGTPAATMEDPIPPETVQRRFDRLLNRVQEIAAAKCGRDMGTVQSVLAEGVDDHDAAMVTGRLSNNTIVHFPGSPALIGKILPVRLTEAKGFYYLGRIEE